METNLDRFVSNPVALFTAFCCGQDPAAAIAFVQLTFSYIAIHAAYEALISRPTLTPEAYGSAVEEPKRKKRRKK